MHLFQQTIADQLISSNPNDDYSPNLNRKYFNYIRVRSYVWAGAPIISIYYRNPLLIFRFFSYIEAGRSNTN
jgi:hypothetical protein